MATPGQLSHLPDLHPRPRWPPGQGRPIRAPAGPRPPLCPPPKATQLALRRDPLLQRPSTGQNEGKAGLLLLPWNLASLRAPRARPPDPRAQAGSFPEQSSLDLPVGRCIPPRGQPGPSSQQVLLLDPGPCACAGAFQVDAPPGRCGTWEAPGVPRKYKQKEVFLSLKTSFPITRTGVPSPWGPVLSRVADARGPRNVLSPGTGTRPRKGAWLSPSPGDFQLQGPPRAIKSLHLCPLYVLLSTFSKQKRGK